MFMDRFDRFRVRVTALDPNAVMYRIGEGPLSFDRSAVESGAFKANFDKHYVTEVVQGEPPKGNYTSVARERLSGVLLGPSSHHGYQVALRKIYEERYARRMSFQDFQRNIENVTDPAAVEQWKQQASSVTTYKTKVAEGEEPIVFKTEQEAEEHFRKTHLPALLTSGNSLEVGGAIAGSLLDKSIGFTVRDAVEREREVPVQMVNALRPYFNEAGLQLFKWKRKILYASGIRPQRHPEQTFSEGISAILTRGRRASRHEASAARRAAAGYASRRCDGGSPAGHEAKLAALAADLHYLVQLGYVVEFQNGCMELPPARKESGQAEHADDHRHDIAAETAGMREAPRCTESARAAATFSTAAAPAPAAPAAARATTQPRRDSRYALLPLVTAASVASLGVAGPGRVIRRLRRFLRRGKSGKHAPDTQRVLHGYGCTSIRSAPKICAHLRNLRIRRLRGWPDVRAAKSPATFRTAGLFENGSCRCYFAAAKFASACAQFTTFHHAFT